MIQKAVIYKKLYSTIILTILFINLFPQGIKAQSISGPYILSSIGTIQNLSNNSMPINFASNLNCLQVNNGASLFVGKVSDGNFNPNCIVNARFNTLGIHIFPNPVSDYAKIKFTNTPPLTDLFSVSVWSVGGVQLQNFKHIGFELKQGKTIDFTMLGSGTYIIQIESSNSFDAIKLIKIK